MSLWSWGRARLTPVEAAPVGSRASPGKVWPGRFECFRWDVGLSKPVLTMSRSNLEMLCPCSGAVGALALQVQPLPLQDSSDRPQSPSPSPAPLHTPAQADGLMHIPATLPTTARWDWEAGLGSSCQEEKVLRKSGIPGTAGMLSPGHSVMCGVPVRGEAVVETAPHCAEYSRASGQCGANWENPLQRPLGKPKVEETGHGRENSGDCPNR